MTETIIRAEQVEKYYAQPSENRIQVIAPTDLAIQPLVSWTDADPLIRRSGHVVQDRPSMVVGWADIPELSTCVGCCSAAWLQSRRNGTDPRPSAFQA